MSREGRCGYRGWTTYLAGSAPVVITVPHGGPCSPLALPDRTPPDCEPGRPRAVFCTKNDLYTLDFGHDLADALETALGAPPHVVCSLLARSKLDPNRPPDEACGPESAARRAFEDYHGFIEEAVETAAGPVLLVDLHGHRKRAALLELGYLLSAEQLRSGRFAFAQSSLLAFAARTDLSVQQLVAGPAGLGGLICERWAAEMAQDERLEPLAVLPSPLTAGPDPGADDYFTGGYTVRRWSGPRVAAVQLEMSADLREDGLRRAAFLRVLADCVRRYLGALTGAPTG